MGRQGITFDLGLLALGSLLLLGTAAVLFTGNLNVVGYGVPLAFAGLAAVFLGVTRLQRTVDGA
ncbi:hypothetical protein C475_06210 [Halosimplex carlsbadense 2-9-1]|uniref:Uncharacterized protein n=1 Tax=Halosimplex carlsbadense 2-9-1 TaxID=797114 RepID=M0CWC6_9EURY|nr:hypothetical protein [Halosimplex carlsbadense]ELZ27490.1 hypothetical protein C475_06210 [Halosimplex carlsbadense 2-9-1]